MRKGLVLGALFAAAVAAGLIAEKPVSASEITRKTMRIESAYVMDDTGNVLQETEVRQEMEAEVPTVESLLKAAEEKKAAEERAAAEKAAAEAKAAEEKAAAEAKAAEEKAAAEKAAAEKKAAEEKAAAEAKAAAEKAAAEKNSSAKSSGSASYTEEELKLVACVIYCEAGNQTYNGKLAVGNVIVNRVNSKLFPNTVHDVLYQYWNGSYQWGLVADGRLDRAMAVYGKRTNATERAMEEDCIKAAKAALAGQQVFNTKYYFFCVYSQSIANNMPYGEKLGTHWFYNNNTTRYDQ